MINKFTLLLLFVLVVYAKVSAQQQAELTNHACGTYEYNTMLMQKNSTYKLRHEQLEVITKNKSAQGAHILSTDTLVTIPVVIHVVYHTTAENIADQQIASQMEVLNEDYSGTNLDAIYIPQCFQAVKAGDIKLRFCLATLDPNNQPTKGITRTKTTTTQFDFADDVKSTIAGGEDAWPADQYLNIWVCNLGGNLLGYAQYPGGPDSTDGVVILYKAFGKNGTAVKPYNKGRTLTHEVGHWLNLLHIWGDDGSDCTGSDEVSDTPNQAGSSFGCPTFPNISCNNGPNGDMFMNYMDYTNDSCMYMFTKEQSIRMRTALDDSRPLIQASNQTDCTPLFPTPDYTTSILPNPNDGNFTIRFKKNIPSSCVITMFDILGHQLFTNTITGIESRSVGIKCGKLATGIYYLRTDVEGKIFKNKILIYQQ